jgi:hypothetical protein
MTAFGRVALTRRHFRCAGCGSSGYPADALVGLDGYLSPRILRLACRLSGDQSFDVAAQRLDELCLVSVDAETLRRHCEAAGAAMAAWMRNDPVAAESFDQAAGEVEVQVDAGKVNTIGGWRDLKVVAFAKRPLGLPATPAEWDTRHLPRPSARVVLADIEEIGTFRRDWRTWADQLGIGSGTELSVLGDGAEWIWNAADAQFCGSRQVLDVYHAMEHIGTAAIGLYGEQTEAAKASFEAGRAALLDGGWGGVCGWVSAELAQADTSDRRAVLDELIGYLAKHTTRLDYRGRLAEGRSIGSGLIEGAIKTLGLRLKARGARWIERNVENMAALVALSHGSNWDAYWSLAA